LASASFRLFWALDCEDEVRELASCWRACVTWSNAAAFSVAVRPPLSLARRAFAARRLACATARSSSALLVSAVASTSPVLTARPAVAATVVTIHEDAPPVFELAADAVVETVATEGALPKARSYVVPASIVPVAATWSMTSVTVAWLVRYCVAVVPPRLGPTTAIAAAPIPTTTRSAAPIVFQRIRGLHPVHVRAARDWQPHASGGSVAPEPEGILKS
jgi:hypothetical protein